MVESYEGYLICISWNHRGMGYDFHIYDADIREVSHNEKPYFYEENALDAAKENIGEILKNKEKE